MDDAPILWDDVYTEDDLVRLVNERLPCRGVSCVVPGFGGGSYHYVALHEAWTREAPDLARTLWRLLRHGEKTKKSTFKMRRLVRERYALTPEDEETLEGPKGFYVPPNPEGPHISLGEFAAGREVRFRVTRVLRYENQKMGYASDFDARSFACEWFALKVAFEGEHAPPTASSPHISACNAGFRFAAPLQSAPAKKAASKGASKSKGRRKK